MTDRLDRALGAYYGLALGDALGMPTQVMSRQDIVRVYGTLTGFEPALPDNPVSAGMPAGSVTDDTDQAVIVGRLIDEGRGRIDPHDTTIGIAGAAAVAAAVSTGVGGGTLGEAVAAAVVAARAGAQRGHWIAGADIACRIEWAWELVRGLPEAEALDRICALIGTSVASQESVPAAFAVLAVADGDPWRAALLAANLGGDSDTIGAIAGAIAGSVAGSVAGLSALPTEAVRTLRTVNSLVLEPLTARLLALR
ncbi:ADP-ribosylglycohydrolase family protein [Streptomyces sp. NPDC057460]|uniref:ADP-ribosylglycohydrolase family protein n=1 Tax=Streptomyces sp. NPDC057460 TaxID=3346141 RepID=UPI0036C1B0A5